LPVRVDDHLDALRGHGGAVDAHGDVYVSDTGDNRVIKIAPRG